MRVPVERLAGVSLVHGTITHDERGHFAKAAQGADLAADPAAGPDVVRQWCSASNRRAGTVRGLHVQVAPYAESKLVWCVTGSIWDVLVDVRPEEPTYGDWAAVRLEAAEPSVLRVPPGVAHGYQTMVDDTVVVYLIDGQHSPAHARTLAWDDPTTAIVWPAAVTVVSERDRAGSPWPLGS